MEDMKYIQERMTAHWHVSDDLDDPRALRWMRLAKSSGLDVDVDSRKIEREALKPYYEELCRRLDEDDPDIVGIGMLMDEAGIAESKAVNGAYEFAISQLSVSEQQRVAQADPLVVSVQYMDRAGFAADVPEYARYWFAQSCKRYSNLPDTPIDPKPPTRPDSDGGFGVRSTNRGADNR